MREPVRLTEPVLEYVRVSPLLLPELALHQLAEADVALAHQVISHEQLSRVSRALVIVFVVPVVVLAVLHKGGDVRVASRVRVLATVD